MSHPPEYWTQANTLAWQQELWASDDDAPGLSPAQREWQGAISGAVARPRSRVDLVRPIPAKTLAKWRKSDNRPAPATYYDGTPVTYSKREG